MSMSRRSDSSSQPALSWPDPATELSVEGGLPDLGAQSQAQLLDLLPEAYVVLDVPSRCFVLANVAAEHLTGFSRVELRTLTPADLLEVADSSRLHLAFESLTPGTISRREWMMRRRSGTSIPIGVISMPVMVEGRPVIQMVVHDLSQEDPAAAQRTLLSLANDRLSISLDYGETLRAVLALLVPRLADRCEIDLLDSNGQPYRAASAAADPASGDGVTTSIVEVPPSAIAQSGPGASDAPITSASDGARGESVSFELRDHARQIGTLTLWRQAPHSWTPDARTLALALSRRAAQAIDDALLWLTAQRELTRRAAILRISRAFAEGEPGSDRVMSALLNEAMALVGGDHGGISLWDAPRGTLIQVHSTTGRSNGMAVNLEGSLSGKAAQFRRPAISNDYQSEYGRGTPGGRFGAQAGIAAPLLHEGRLLGVISVGTRVHGRQFSTDDAEAVELLANMAASMLGTLERAQLQAVSLAARELAHRLNNDLALAVGTIDMLREEPTLDPDIRELVDDAADGLQRVGEQLKRLQQLARFQTRETPVGRALDLDRSTGAGTDPA